MIFITFITLAEKNTGVLVPKNFNQRGYDAVAVDQNSSGSSYVRDLEIAGLGTRLRLSE
ncbi:MAG: hypothetical protein JO334_09350 [Verrucomicrobia bacterium]|nr:hypothetical protein [Verrucomicrobiota bacterium]